MTRAFIFDLDGTLADTLESLVFSVKATLREMDLDEITDDQCRHFVGNGARYLMDHAIRAAGDPEGERLDEAMEVYGRIFDENCTYHVTPYAGMEDVLRKLKGKGIRLAVLSNKPHRQTVKVVEAVFGKELFDCAQGQQEGVKRKPDPAGIYRILEKLGVSVEDCVYVGDSEVDLETGKRAGVRTVSVGWGFRTRKELEDAGAGRILERTEELLEYEEP